MNNVNVNYITAFYHDIVIILQICSGAVWYICRRYVPLKLVDERIKSE